MQSLCVTMTSMDKTENDIIGIKYTNGMSQDLADKALAVKTDPLPLNKASFVMYLNSGLFYQFYKLLLAAIQNLPLQISLTKHIDINHSWLFKQKSDFFV